MNPVATLALQFHHARAHRRRRRRSAPTRPRCSASSPSSRPRSSAAIPSIVLASETAPLAAITFAEILATSDLPGGVVNILTGTRAELAPHFASHMDVNAIVDGSGDAAIAADAARRQRAQSQALRPPRRSPRRDWSSAEGRDPYWILDTVEMKTAWHPIGDSDSARALLARPR